MNWFAVHAGLAVVFREDRQKAVPVFYEIVLCSADSAEEARTKVNHRYNTMVPDETFTWDGLPARLVLLGVRRIILTEDPDRQPSDGTELTYELLEFDNLEMAKKFAAGATVNAVLIEDPGPTSTKNE